jgi:hypothetical protein
LLGTQHHERDRRCLNGPEFGDRDLPRTQNFQKQGFDVVIDFVEFVDKQHAGAAFVTEKTHQRPLGEEVQGMQMVADFVPGVSEIAGLCFQKKLLQRFGEFADDLQHAVVILPFQSYQLALPNSSERSHRYKGRSWFGNDGQNSSGFVNGVSVGERWHPAMRCLSVAGTDSNDREVQSSAWMYVWGGEAAKYARSENESAFVMADKKRYEPGDIARLMFIGQKTDLHYFVTIEAGSTTRSYELDATGTMAELKLPITAEFAPIFFVHALAIQGGSRYVVDTYRSANFEVALTEQQLTIDVQPSKGRFEPGDDATVKIRTVSGEGKPVSAELSLGVVDGRIMGIHCGTAADGRFLQQRAVEGGGATRRHSGRQGNCHRE